MLQIEVPMIPEKWDSKKEEFIPATYKTLRLEHSLVSVSKWESKWCKSFLATVEKTDEELMDYIKCMTITPNVADEVYDKLTQSNVEEITRYIHAPMTATVFYDDENRGTKKETITSELIYYWMFAMGIPYDCRKWHLNRLITLIRVCNIKNTPPKKMKQSEIMRRNKALNDARRKRLGTKG